MAWLFKKKEKPEFDPKNMSILVVDDESDVRAVVGKLLESHGYSTAAAKDGAEALAMLRKRDFDLMVLDIMMPKMDGYEVMNALKDVKPDLPVVMLTAKAAPKDIWKGYVEGCHYYVTKPFDKLTLIRAVNYLLGGLSDPQRREMENML
jgi:CheY-like chemotaxis protein